jgi:P-type conjugative transfer protein TrbJ
MKTKNNHALALSLASLIGASCLGAARQAEAITVYDPSNHAQNILTALRAMKSNLNEARQIENQVKSLANEMENLKKLDFSVIDEFSNQMNDLFEVTGEINGLMADFNSLQEEFERLYPDFAEMENFDAEELAQKAKEWLEMSRETVLGASKTGAKVLENLPKSQEQLEELVGQSQGAAGILQAAQAGNQIAANVAGNMQTLNAQIATYTQAMMTYLMEQQQAKVASEVRSKEALEGWGERKTSKKVALAGLSSGGSKKK